MFKTFLDKFPDMEPTVDTRLMFMVGINVRVFNETYIMSTM